MDRLERFTGKSFPPLLSLMMMLLSADGHSGNPMIWKVVDVSFSFCLPWLVRCLSGQKKISLHFSEQSQSRHSMSGGNEFSAYILWKEHDQRYISQMVEGSFFCFKVMHILYVPLASARVAIEAKIASRKTR